MRKETTIPLLAIVLLLIATTSSAYVYINQSSVESTVGESILINGESFGIATLFESIENRTAIVAEVEYEGIALDGLIEYVGVSSPQSHSYRFVADDGYSKTVEWSHLADGILTLDQRSVFSNLPKAFSVRNVVEIEVI